MARTGMLASELAGELHALVAGEAVPPGLSSVAREKTEEPTLRSALASCLLTASGFMRWRRGAAAGGCEILTLRADPATLAIGESKSGSQGSTPPDACVMCRNRERAARCHAGQEGLFREELSRLSSSGSPSKI